MSALDCTCPTKTFVVERAGAPLVQRHRRGCPRNAIAVLVEFHPEHAADIDPVLRAFERRLATICALPLWVLRGESPPTALVKVGCTALVRISDGR